MKSELIGNIIDIFQDEIMDERGEIINGEKYDNIARLLLELFKNYGINV